MKRYQVILIDVLNIFHANTATNHHLTTTLNDGSVMCTGGIYGTLRSIKKLERERLVEGGLLYFLADISVARSTSEERPSSHRLLIDPQYKANRNSHSEAFYASYNLMLSILRSYSSDAFLVCRQGFEADDFVKPVISHLPSDTEVLLVSGDSDWARALSPTVEWLHQGQLDTLETYQERLGYSPLNNGIVLYKSFRGDGDNIPKGVLGIPEPLILAIIERVHTVHDLIQSLPSFEFLSPHWKELILMNRGRLALNERLVDFLPITEKEYVFSVFKTSFESSKLRVFYSMLGFDIEKLDPRIKPLTVKSENPADFFQAQKVDRA